ncbi:MAG: hypothetical protein H0X29_00490 [Parachlamydiaceae bacterium]|nr:hypothetical protein [Parachlamydiaceae bacterium]
MDDDTLNPKKTFPRKGKRCSHTIIKDRDLQIHMPTIEDTHHGHRNAIFKTRTVSFSERLSPSIFHENEIKVAMAEAESAYASMMLIRQQLKETYEEFMHSNSS